MEISRRRIATARDKLSCSHRQDDAANDVVRRSNRGLPLTLVDLGSGMLSAEEIPWCLHACASSLRALHFFELFVVPRTAKTPGDKT
jgi:hypothetical protein